MNRNRICKGQLGYVKSERKAQLIKTCLLFLLPIAIFIMGMLSTGTRKNLLSVVAILGLLPASRALVVLIMLYRAKTVGTELGEMLTELINAFPEGKRNLACECNITTQERNYPVAQLAVMNGCVLGYSDYQDKPGKKKPVDYKKLEDYLKECLPNNGYKNYTVKIFTNPDQYKDRILGLSENAEVSETDEKALLFLLGLSL